MKYDLDTLTEELGADPADKASLFSSYFDELLKKGQATDVGKYANKSRGTYEENF